MRKQKKAQGSLEYLVILASVLAVSAIVVLFMSGTFGTTGADVSGCKSAAGQCAARLVTTYSPPCPACDTACVDASGKDLMSQTEGCGGACTLCKQGRPMRISSSGWQPHELEPDSSTAGLWHFNNGSGTHAVDSSGNNNGCTISGAVWNSSGKFGNALTFDNTDDIVSLPKQLVSPTASITFSAWIKTTGTGIQHIVGQGRSFGNSYSDKGIYTNGASGKATMIVLSATCGNYFFATSTTSVNDGNWHLITSTYDNSASSISIHVDGVLEQTTTSVTVCNEANDNIFIGRWNAPGLLPFVGTIDEVAIYNRAKTDSEIWVDANA